MEVHFVHITSPCRVPTFRLNTNGACVSKTIAIVGAGPGVGLAVAERFGRDGFKVALISRNPDTLSQLEARLSAVDAEASSFPADVLDRTALAGALETAAKH